MNFYRTFLLLTVFLSAPALAEQHSPPAQGKGVVEEWSALQNAPSRAAAQAFIDKWTEEPLYRALALALLETLPEGGGALAPAPALIEQMEPPLAGQPLPDTEVQTLPAPPDQVVLTPPEAVSPQQDTQPAPPPLVDKAPAPKPDETGTEEQAALAFLLFTIDLLSQPETDLRAAVETYYTDRIRFYGNDWSQAQVIADKRGFFARWPVRRYEPLPDKTTITCENNICAIESEMIFTAESPARQARSRGRALFNYVVDMRGTPLIALETSEVLERFQ